MMSEKNLLKVNKQSDLYGEHCELDPDAQEFEPQSNKTGSSEYVAKNEVSKSNNDQEPYLVRGVWFPELNGYNIYNRFTNDIHSLGPIGMDISTGITETELLNLINPNFNEFFNTQYDSFSNSSIYNSNSRSSNFDSLPSSPGYGTLPNSPPNVDSSEIFFGFEAGSMNPNQNTDQTVPHGFSDSIYSMTPALTNPPNWLPYQNMASNFYLPEQPTFADQSFYCNQPAIFGIPPDNHYYRSNVAYQSCTNADYGNVNGPPGYASDNSAPHMFVHQNTPINYELNEPSEMRTINSAGNLGSANQTTSRNQPDNRNNNFSHRTPVESSNTGNTKQAQNPQILRNNDSNLYKIPEIGSNIAARTSFEKFSRHDTNVKKTNASCSRSYANHQSQSISNKRFKTNHDGNCEDYRQASSTSHQRNRQQPSSTSHQMNRQQSSSISHPMSQPPRIPAQSSRSINSSEATDSQSNENSRFQKFFNRTQFLPQEEGVSRLNGTSGYSYSKSSGPSVS